MLGDMLDAAILLWLVRTWFYEGHHRKCSVAMICDVCGRATDAACQAEKAAQ